MQGYFLYGRRRFGDAYAILSAIGNGKWKYSGIESTLQEGKSREQLSRLIDADVLQKRKPINSGNRKYIFYEIKSNVIRFYFAFLLDSEDYITINSKAFFENMVKPSLVTYVAIGLKISQGVILLSCHRKVYEAIFFV